MTLFVYTNEYLSQHMIGTFIPLLIGILPKSMVRIDYGFDNELQSTFYIVVK